MLDRLREIDTSALDQLSQLKQEQEILEDRLQKMEERSEAVSPVVFDRVRDDYQKRLRDLEEEARPLKAKGRDEFAKLTALHQEAEEALESARLDGEELQFRNELGEFAEDEFKDLSKESNKVIKERQSHVDEAAKLKAAFVEAFRSEEELAQDSDESLPPPITEETPVDEGTEEIREEPVPPELPEGEGTGEDGDPQRDTLPPLPEEEDLDATEFETDATRELETDEGEGEDLDDRDDGEGDDAPEQEEPLPQADPTIILTRARFVALDGPDADEEFILNETPATLGRAPDNDIRVPDESVSRHHAEVVEGPEGHTVRDMGSENGTYVNGEPIEERRLNDGDVVQVGSCRLVFRL